ncbi:MAG: hypothetical protein RL711_240 [Bacteroidota bacterium]
MIASIHLKMVKRFVQWLVFAAYILYIHTINRQHTRMTKIHRTNTYFFLKILVLLGLLVGGFIFHKKYDNKNEAIKMEINVQK